MSSIESIRERVQAQSIPVAEIDQLKQRCLVNTLLSPGIRLCPGLRSTFAELSLRRSIWGEYGIEKIDMTTKRPVAVAGFFIQNGVMEISHTPQGIRPNEFQNPPERHRLGRSQYRYEMVLSLIELAKQLGLTKVVGNCAVAHHELDLGLVPYEKLRKAIDDVYVKLGFEFNKNTFQYEFVINQ